VIVSAGLALAGAKETSHRIRRTNCQIFTKDIFGQGHVPLKSHDSHQDAEQHSPSAFQCSLLIEFHACECWRWNSFGRFDDDEAWPKEIVRAEADGNRRIPPLKVVNVVRNSN
jgi:hypothetical protein